MEVTVADSVTPGNADDIHIEGAKEVTSTPVVPPEKEEVKEQPAEKETTDTTKPPEKVEASTTAPPADGISAETATDAATKDDKSEVAKDTNPTDTEAIPSATPSAVEKTSEAADTAKAEAVAKTDTTDASAVEPKEVATTDQVMPGHTLCGQSNLFNYVHKCGRATHRLLLHISRVKPLLVKMNHLSKQRQPTLPPKIYANR